MEFTFPDITCVGKFQRTHALKGELNAIFDVDYDLLTPDTPLFVMMEGDYVPFYPESVRPKGSDAALVKLQDIDTQEEARNFVNCDIYMRDSDLPDADEDEEGEYVADLIDFKIFDTDNHYIGTIRDFDDSTDNPLFIVENEGQQIFIPIAEEFINSINPESMTIIMDLPEGLINLNS